MTDAPPTPGLGDRFLTTRWSLVLSSANAGGGNRQGDAALEELCRAYWRPVFAFVTRRGHSPTDAQDLTQDFFVHTLRVGLVRKADPTQGRFRSLLLKTLQNFLSDAVAKRRTQKRGGRLEFVPWNESVADAPAQFAASEGGEGGSAERKYDLQWAATVVGRALRRLREECESIGRRRAFDVLSNHLTGERATVSYASAAETLKLSESAVKSLIHRLRQRYAALLREEVGHTLQDTADLEDEIRYLCSVLATGTQENSA